jgi:A/G-specific adenine glycosylase
VGLRPPASLRRPPGSRRPVGWLEHPQSLKALRRRLLDWYDAERRPLPWRDVADPYKVWVSEIMLQQTRVETVRPYYERWLTRFPDVETLAQAPLDDVLRAWSGLGYYTRARNLHKAAKVITQDHGGRVPRQREALLALPGIGPYSAGAIASIAHRERVPAVDGNALRVLSRLTGERRAMEEGATKRRLEQEAARLVHPQRPGEWNQAIMELGATHCRPRRPDCQVCPVSRWCTAHHNESTAEIPRTKPKRPVTVHTVHFALIRHNDTLLLARRADKGLLGGTWGLPGGETTIPLSHHVKEQTGLRVRTGRELGAAEHVFTHRRWCMQVHACTLQGDPARAKPSTHWVRLEDLGDAPLAKATRKAIEACGIPAS